MRLISEFSVFSEITGSTAKRAKKDPGHHNGFATVLFTKAVKPSQGLAALQIAALNFHTGEVTYADGHTALLSAHTLHADTEGMPLTQIQEAVLDKNGAAVVHALNAGTVLEHESISVGDWVGTQDRYIFNSCLRNKNKGHRPLLCASMNDYAWRNIA